MFVRQMRAFTRNLRALRGFVEMAEPVLEENAERRMKEHSGGILMGGLIFYGLASEQDRESEQLAHVRDVIDEAAAQGLPPLVQRGEEDGVAGVFLVNPEDGTTRFINEGLAREVAQEAMAEATIARRQAVMLYRSALVSLVGYVEWFVSRVLAKYFREYPALIGPGDKCFSLQDLETFEAIDDAREHLITERVSEILRGSVSDWLEFLKSKAKLSMDGYLQAERDAVVEVFERRNLVVHNNGVVNGIYMRNVASALRPGVEKGQALVITRAYVEESIDRLEKVFLLVAAELWKKLRAEDLTRAELLNELAYEHLRATNWTVSAGLSTFASLDGAASERDRLIGQVNTWLSRKRLDGVESVVDEVEATDFTAKDETFKIARLALLDDFDGLAETIPLAIERGAVTVEALYEWPLMEDFRRSERFTEVADCVGPSPYTDEILDELDELDEIEDDDGDAGDVGEAGSTRADDRDIVPPPL